jgi:hypothetical protein
MPAFGGIPLTINPFGLRPKGIRLKAGSIY